MIEKGLLELPTIRQIWMNHTREAINGELWTSIIQRILNESYNSDIYSGRGDKNCCPYHL